MRRSEATERFHATVRRREAELVARLGTPALLPSHRAGGLLRAPAAASPAKMTFKVDTALSCTASQAAKVTGILVHENADLALYQDSTQWAGTENDPARRWPRR